MTWTRLQIGVIAILVVAYLVQVVTPLRLHADTVVLMTMAESAAHGTGFLRHGNTTVFPPGYPMLLAILMKLNIAHVWVMVALNIGFLLVGLWAVASMLLPPQFLGTRSSVLNVCILSLLSFIVIRHTTIPLTDVCFFGIAMCCLAVMVSAASRFTVWKLLAVLLLAVFAICVRRVGVALIPPLLWMVIVRASRRMKTALTAIIASVGVVLAVVIYSTSTLRDYKDGLGGKGLIDSLWSVPVCHFKELGEITLNMVAAALPPAVQQLLPVLGAFVLLLLAVCVVSRRSQFGAIDLFFISYAAVILVWPFYDPRFWLPVLPLLFAYAGLAVSRVRHWTVKPLLGLYAAVFVILGLATLFRNTEVSLSRANFGDVYPNYHETYCAAGYCTGPFDASKVNADALHLLLTYK